MNEYAAEVRDFISDKPLKHYIGGESVDSISGRTFEDLDPGNGQHLATLAAGQSEDVDHAVQAARKAFTKSKWATMSAAERGVVLHRLADLIDKHAGILAALESRDVGKPVAQALGFDIPHAAKTFRYYADLAVHKQMREPVAISGHEAWAVLHPYGVCGFIFPWNFPFLLIGWGVAPALAAGNAIVIKPAEDTPLTALYFAKLAEQAGVPPGIVNVVTGLGAEAGAALAAHPGLNRMSFTGSPEVGRLIGELCGRNLTPVKLELGGKGAAIVFDDVSVDKVARDLAAAVTLNAGQVCCTATRWLVHESIADEFVAKAVAAMDNLRIGYGGDANTELGPVVSEKQRQRVLGYIKKGAAEGAEVYLAGGEVEVSNHSKGFYVRPAILGGSPDNICAREEIFGPVSYVMRFRNQEEAIDLVNRSPYGLANSVWSADLPRASRVAEKLVAGNSWINAHNLFPHGVSYGGVNLSGAGGGVLGPATLNDYLRHQSVVRPTA